MKTTRSFSAASTAGMTVAAFVSFILVAKPAASQSTPWPPDAGATALAKVSDWVLRTTQAGRETDFLVVLSRQADLSRAAALPSREEKGRFVHDALLKTAAGTQGPLLELLEQIGVPHQSFFIVNAIAVTGRRDVALLLAARADVARVEGNPLVSRVLPRPENTPFQTYGPTAVEPGITQSRAPEVWALGFTGQGIVGAGQDTGISWTHPALKPAYRGWNGTAASHDYNWHDAIHSSTGTCGHDAPAPCDDYGHGTHTMGTVLGLAGTNQIGMAPGAKWIGCRNMNDGAGTPATYLECFQFFLAPYPVGGSPSQGDPAKAPHVTNNSWGCPPSEGCGALTLQAAVATQRAAGIFTTVSAGNAGPSCSSVADPPAIYDEAFSVGALQTGTDTIASFSSRGPVTIDGSGRVKPDIAAPGTGVRSSVPGGGYASMSGTSMAGPHVAGAVALLWSAQPALVGQIDQTERILADGAAPIASTECGATSRPNYTFGWGRLDAKAAVDLALVRPIFSGLSPSFGSVLGGTLVTITGANFVSGAGVTFGGTAGTSVVVVNSTKITAMTPAHAAGSVDVVVTNPDTSTATQSGAFTYVNVEPAGLVEDAHTTGSSSSNVNNILEPGETVLVNPSWKNVSAAPLALTGTASAFTGPVGAFVTYTLIDTAAGYGTIAPGATADSFSAGGPSYRLFVSNPATRPAAHWDATFLETLSNGTAKTWTLHVGQSFTDVPVSDGAYPFVENIFHNGITAGCGGGNYCPASNVTRWQMAVFLAIAMAGSSAAVPSSGTVPSVGSYNCTLGGNSLFGDVPPTDGGCRFIHYIYANGVTAGCGAGNYCPASNVTRWQMAPFLVTAFHIPSLSSTDRVTSARP
jgi:serine protease AprX